MTQNEGRLLAHLRYQMQTMGDAMLNAYELKAIVLMLDRLARVELYETHDDDPGDELPLDEEDT